MSGVFVGREAELARIGRVLDTRSGAAVIVGDPGSGKSRLVEEAVKGIAQIAVFRVVGYEPERLVPLAAASDVLRALVPDLAFGDPDPRGFEPIRLFEAAHRAAVELGPALLVVDDVQWTDDLSLAFVHYLLRASASAGDLRLLTAGRPAVRTHRLVNDVVRLLGPEQVVEVALAGLERTDGIRLAISLDTRLDEAQAGEIWERGAGLPFWIEALARTGGEPVDAGRLLTSRLRDAGPDASDLLALLAVVARPLPEEDGASLLGWPAERVESAADELVAHGIASRVRGSVGLAHDLLRAAATDGLPPARSRALHSKVARWLGDAAHGDVATLREALEHRSAAGESSADLAHALASSPQRRRLGRDGLLVLKTIADEPGSSEGLRTLVAELASELGEHALALERWFDLAGQVRDVDRRSTALLQASKGAFELGPLLPGRARELLEAAAAGTQSEEIAVRVRAHEARVLLWLEHRTADGAAVAREAVEWSERLGSGAGAQRARLESLRAAYEAAMQEDRGEEMLRLADRLLAQSDSDGSRVDALISRGLAQRFARPVLEAVASFRSAADLAARRILPTQAVDAGFWLAQSLHDQGSVKEAERIAGEAQELAARVGDVSRVRAHVRRVADAVALTRGRREEGLAGLAADAEAESDPHYRIGSRQAAAQFLARADGREAATEIVSLLELARADAAASGCPRCSNELQLATVEALARIGRVGEAEAELAQVRPSASADPLPALWRLQADALLEVARGSDGAVRLLEEAQAAAAGIGRGLDELWLGIDLGRALAGIDRRRGAAELRAVAAGADELGAVTLREVAEQELRRLGVRTWRRGRSRVEDGSLSEREREIAELVATGASNPEIAQALFLSRKTVERHVSNVLAKHGVRNRAELAALLAREGEGAPR
ncbi:MAG: LuxR C-terminal-related transcriptional regulator [Gaiellaceae bacterium]